MAKRQLKQNLSGRIKKVKTNNVLVPFFEAISNSIHSIEDSGREGEILVELVREPIQFEMENEGVVPISSFKITDNGLGFNSINMASFESADSTHKEDRGGKGIGRVSWLKFFENAKIESVFQENGKTYRREFTFDQNGINEKDLVELSKDNPLSTTVSFGQLHPIYEKKSRKDIDQVAISIIEHFVSYFVTGAIPTIILKDGVAKKNINEFYKESLGKTAEHKKFTIAGNDFSLTGVKNYIGNSTHSIFLCGNKRVAEKVNLGKIDPFFNKRFHDEELKGYAYHAYIEADYLNNIVNDDRDGFRFAEDGSLDEQIEGEISKNQLIKQSTSIIKELLKDEIEKRKEENINTVSRYILEFAPQYRMILKNCSNVISNIHDSDPEKIDLALRKIQFQEETKTRKDIGALMKKADEKSVDMKKEWEEKTRELLTKLSDTGKSNLASYILQRKMILELLKKRLEFEDDSYAKEEAIHSLVFPLRQTSDDVGYEDQNLWLIDERLSYHYYLASDKPLSTLDPIDVDSSKEPDIIVFNRPIALIDRPESERSDSIEIIEFKRPGETSVKGSKNPVDQILEYIELIQEGKAKNRKGRPIDVSSSTYFFGYVICELDNNLKKVLKRKTMRDTPDERGMFGYFEDHRAYIEVISYDKMLDNALKRNRILFEKLQVPPT